MKFFQTAFIFIFYFSTFAKAEQFIETQFYDFIIKKEPTLLQWQYDQIHYTEKTCSQKSHNKEIQAGLKQALKQTPYLSKKCIQASQKSSVGGGGQECSLNIDSKTKKISQQKSYNRSYIREEQNYSDITTSSSFIQWAVKKSMDCLKPYGVSIDPAALFLIINNESHFKYHVGQGGGLGLMQMTTLGIETSKRKASEKKFNFECENLPGIDLSFKMSKGRYNKPAIPICEFASPGTATIRNLIYGILHYAENETGNIHNNLSNYNGGGTPAYIENTKNKIQETINNYEGSDRKISSIQEGLTWIRKNCLLEKPEPRHLLD